MFVPGETRKTGREDGSSKCAARARNALPRWRIQSAPQSIWLGNRAELAGGSGNDDLQVKAEVAVGDPIRTTAS